MTDSTLAFIGGGNMAGSLIGGLIADGWSPDRIQVADPDPARISQLAERFSVITTRDNSEAVANADAVVLAVKPQILQDVAGQIAPAIRQQQPVVISIAAGIRETTLRSWLALEFTARLRVTFASAWVIVTSENVATRGRPEPGCTAAPTPSVYAPRASKSPNM